MPSLAVVDGIVAALVLIEVDAVWGDRWLALWPRLFGVGAEGARQMLATLAGSMMSLMGITFSMTLVALALASSQYTSRILRNFMKNRATQTTLGVFAGIFTYCLIVLRSIRGGDPGFIPSTAVFFAFVLALAGVVVLIFFIHHIASSIQAVSIIASVAQETNAAMERVFPQMQGREPDGAADTVDEQVLAPGMSGPGTQCRRRSAATSRVWMRMRSWTWRETTGPSCGWSVASARSRSRELCWHRSP